MPVMERASWLSEDPVAVEAQMHITLLMERVAARMPEDDTLSSSSGSDIFICSATTSEEGSPKSWTSRSKGFYHDSRPSSPAWSASSGEYDCPLDVPSVSFGEGDSWGRTPKNTPFSGFMLPGYETSSLKTQRELFSLQRQLESLSVQQAQFLEAHLAKTGQKGRSLEGEGKGRHSERTGRDEDERRSRCHKEQTRTQAQRRAIGTLANQQPNERLAPASRASRKNVVCGATGSHQRVAVPVLPLKAKEGGTGVFLPMAVLRTSTEPRKKQGPPPTQASRRLGSNLGSKVYQPGNRSRSNLHQNQVSTPAASNFPVVDCSEAARISIVSFAKRDTALGSQRRKQILSNSNHPLQHQELLVQYNGNRSNRNRVHQREQPESCGGRLDSLGLPEEWVY